MPNSDSVNLEVKDKQLLKLFDNMATKAKGSRKMMRAIGKVITDYIEQNFETEGQNSGDKWEPWSDDYKKARERIGRGEGKILTLGGELRNSIRRKYTDTSVIVGTNKEYAAVHNFGFDGPNKKGVMMNMPKRTFMEFTEDLEIKIALAVWDELFEEYSNAEDQEGLKFLNQNRPWL